MVRIWFEVAATMVTLPGPGVTTPTNSIETIASGRTLVAPSAGEMDTRALSSPNVVVGVVVPVEVPVEVMVEVPVKVAVEVNVVVGVVVVGDVVADVVGVDVALVLGVDEGVVVVVGVVVSEVVAVDVNVVLGLVVKVLVAEVVAVREVSVVDGDVVAEVVGLVVWVDPMHELKLPSRYDCAIAFIDATATSHSFGSYKNPPKAHPMSSSGRVEPGPLNSRSAWFSDRAARSQFAGTCNAVNSRLDLSHTISLVCRGQTSKIALIILT